MFQRFIGVLCLIVGGLFFVGVIDRAYYEQLMNAFGLGAVGLALWTAGILLILRDRP